MLACVCVSGVLHESFIGAAVAQLDMNECYRTSDDNASVRLDGCCQQDQRLLCQRPNAECSQHVWFVLAVRAPNRAYVDVCVSTIHIIDWLIRKRIDCQSAQTKRVRWDILSGSFF